ncbi:MAG TPA: putative quinol monooxygenase [Gaiellaceae bacterium]|nr:putative quinol monooxygenase [Gaiellaceae bacterium]
MAVVLVARWVAREGEEERVLAILEELAPASRAEPGCLYYQPTRDNEDPRRFLVFEVYADEDAFCAHSESEHFQRLVLDDAVPLLEGRDRSFYTTVG